MLNPRTVSKLLIKNNYILSRVHQVVADKSFLTCLNLKARISRHKNVSRPVAAVDNFQEPSKVIDLENHWVQHHQESLPEITKLNDSPKHSLKSSLPFAFVKLEKNDPRLSEVMMIVKSKKLRAKTGLILLEGKRLIQDALSAGVQPECFFFSRASDIMEINLPTGDSAVPVYKALFKDLQLWSDVVTSPGVFGIFKIPNPNVLNSPEESMPLTIVCDNVRDPGNLGSILRVAAGVGSSKIVLTKGCTDLWDTKVLRSSAGAHFRIPIVNKVDWHEMHKHISEANHVFLADNKEVMILKPDEEIEKNEDSEETEEDKALCSLFSKSVPYFDINYVKKSPVVVIVGGETHGLSREAFHFARFQDSCTRVTIPLFNSVESLNSSIALSVLAYEMQRQFILSNRSSEEMFVN